MASELTFVEEGHVSWKSCCKILEFLPEECYPDSLVPEPRALNKRFGRLALKKYHPDKLRGNPEKEKLEEKFTLLVNCRDYFKAVNDYQPEIDKSMTTLLEILMDLARIGPEQHLKEQADAESKVVRDLIANLPEPFRARQTFELQKMLSDTDAAFRIHTIQQYYWREESALKTKIENAKAKIAIYESRIFKNPMKAKKIEQLKQKLQEWEVKLAALPTEEKQEQADVHEIQEERMTINRQNLANAQLKYHLVTKGLLTAHVEMDDLYDLNDQSAYSYAGYDDYGAVDNGYGSDHSFMALYIGVLGVTSVVGICAFLFCLVVIIVLFVGRRRIKKSEHFQREVSDSEV